MPLSSFTNQMHFLKRQNTVHTGLNSWIARLSIHQRSLLSVDVFLMRSIFVTLFNRTYNRISPWLGVITNVCIFIVLVFATVLITQLVLQLAEDSGLSIFMTTG